MTYKIEYWNEYHNTSSDATSLELARTYVKRKLEEGENHSPTNARIIHPDGKKEYWYAAITITATLDEDGDRGDDDD